MRQDTKANLLIALFGVFFFGAGWITSVYWQGFVAANPAVSTETKRAQDREEASWYRAMIAIDYASRDPALWAALMDYLKERVHRRPGSDEWMAYLDSCYAQDKKADVDIILLTAGFIDTTLASGRKTLKP